MQLHPYRFTKSKVTEILKLNPVEFLVLYKTINLIWKSYGYVFSSQIVEVIENDFIKINSIIEKLCKSGLLKKSSDEEISYGDYDSSEKAHYVFSHSDFTRLGSQLSTEELYIYFYLLFNSDTGSCIFNEKDRIELSSRLSTPFFKKKISRLKEIEEQLTAKGFLAPVVKLSDHYKYILYNGSGELANYNK